MTFLSRGFKNLQWYGMTKKVPKSVDFGTFLRFYGTLESEEEVVHNATITAVKKVRKLGFEKVTFCNFFGERFCTHAEFLWPVAP